MSSINCVYGCEQGRCRSQKYCTDTDGGNVPSVRGMVVDAWGHTFTDDCLESGAHAGYLRENYCSSSPGGGRNMISLKCEYGCSQGRCRPAPTAGACTPGASKECNSGSSGICSAGKQTCSSSGAWGGCSPLIQKGTVPEICNNEEDDDCDGATDGSDSDCVVSCPAGSYDQGGKCVCAANYATVGSACKPVIEIHRLRSALWADYLFTVSPGEASSSGGNYTAESSGNFKVFQRNEGGMRALRRCSVSVGGGRDHFLSTSSNCEGPVGQSDGGVLGYIDSPLSGGQCAAHRKPLYRCFSLTHHMHLTTTRASECVAAADPANRPADKLVLEGMLGCVPTD